MIKTAPTFALTREQASRLQAYLQTYRRYAFAALLPCIDRNTALRALQALQGKLIAALDQHSTPFRFVLAREDMMILRTVAAELLLLYAKEPASAQRNIILADVAALKASLKSV